MTKASSFGLFSWLPYELREQIWQEFLPVDDETRCLFFKKRKAYLDILCTSRDLYNEISNCLYSNTYLQFDLLSNYISEPFLWTTVYFKKINCERKETIKTITAWKLSDRDDARRRGFYNLRLHPNIETIKVNLFIPNSDDLGELWLLWWHVSRLVEMLKEIPSLPHLIIRLQKIEGHDTWNYTHQALVWHTSVVVLPFYTLRNIRLIKIETHLEELKNMMDWIVIDGASGIVSKRNPQESTLSSIDSCSEHDIDRRVEEDFIWIHQRLFDTYHTVTTDFMRRLWFSNWFVQNEDGSIHSEFEKRMIHIINTYPELIRKYDPRLRTLTHMHRAMFSLYHAALHSKDIYIAPTYPVWDRSIWFTKYRTGITDQQTLGLDGLLPRKASYYFKFIHSDGFWSTIPRVVEEWNSLKRYLEKDRFEESLVGA